MAYLDLKSLLLATVSLASLFGRCDGTEDVLELTGPDLWAQRASHPAVVNPVLGQDAANVISLRGEWEFMSRDEFGRNRPGPVCDWMWEAKPWPRKISVPGCWEAQGVGEPGMSDPWNIAIDHNAKPIRHRYMGVGCYRRTVDVPESWRGKRVWLKVGGAKSIGWFHVNGRHVACVDNYCGTYKYEITDLVAPGKKATIVAQVRNDVPSRKGLLSAMHRWGGLYRDVELEATPSVFIDDAWVRGDFDGRTAEVHVKVEGEQRNAALCLRATVEGETVEQAIEQSNNPNNQTILKVSLRNFKAWSPEHPNLYTGLVELVENGRVIHARRERFGVRKLEVRGKEFYLNGRPYFFRGFGDDHVYPITGITPADIDVHRRHLALARKAGFNVVRLHTHTELPEYFEAADEIGILIEAELPYYNNEPPEGQSFDPKRDVTELWRNYRRYPSFGVYSMGNEGSFGGELDRALHRYVKAMDPDRLKINQDSSFAGNNPPESADYTGGPITEWKRGSFNPDRPFVNHEYLNLGAKLDSRLEPRFTGVWQPPVTRDGRKAWLETFGLDLEWGDRLQDASHALQAVYQKRGIESLRCDPYSDGYHFWTVVDVVVSNLCTYSAQGLLTPFWEKKSRGLSLEDFAVFNSPSCVLLDKALGNMVFTAGEAFSSDVLLAHYGDEALSGVRLDWTLAADGRSLGTGSVPVGDQPVGAVRKVAEVSFKMPAVACPVKATLSLTLVSQTSQAISNSWPCWIFPVRGKRDGRRIAVAEPYLEKLEGRYGSLLPAARASEADVVIAPFGSRLADESLKRGQRVIALDGLDGEPNVSMGWWFMGSQVGTALREHPVFGDLPHEGVLSPLLFRVLKTGRKLPFTGLAAKDMLAVGEGGDACYLYLAQAKSEKGRLLLSFGLDVLSDTPESAALLDGFVDYALSNDFDPESELLLASQPDSRVREIVDPVRVVSSRCTNDVLILLQKKYGQISEGKFGEGTGPLLEPGDWLILDYGRELHGSLQIGTGTKGGREARARIRFGESVAETLAPLGERGACNDHAIRDEVIVLPFMGRREIGETGFRFVRLENAGDCPVQLEYVRAVSLMRPMKQIGTFRSSDERLNRVFDTAVRTVHLCCQDYVWDGIKRDRLVWMGDMHPETMAILNVFGAAEVLPMTLNYIAETTSPEEWVNGFPTYTLWWLRNLAAWYRFTGDKKFLCQFDDYLEKTSAHVMSVIIDGAWTKDGEYGAFLDWPTHHNSEAELAGAQALAVLAMDDLRFLLSELGRSVAADAAGRLLERMRKTHLGPHGSKSAAAMLALSGLCGPAEMFNESLGRNGHAGVSTFYGYYMIEAMSRAEQGQRALDTVRDYWGGMLDMGATSFWEDFNLSWTNNACRIDALPVAGRKDVHGDFGEFCYKGFRHSLCHGWSSGPAAWCINHVLGIRSLDVGCRTVLVKPFLGDLDWAEGAMALPTGESVRVRVDRKTDGKLSLQVDAPNWIRIVREVK